MLMEGWRDPTQSDCAGEMTNVVDTKTDKHQCRNDTEVKYVDSTFDS